MWRALPLMLLALMSAGCQDPDGLVIENARILDGLGGEISNGSIFVRDGRIVSVTEGPTEVHAATVIDAEGMTVMPGITDLHVHSTVEFWLEPETVVRRNVIPGPEVTISNDVEMEAFMTERLAARMRSFLEAGVTTIIDPGGLWPYVLEIRDRIERGEMEGPRMFVVGPIFTAPGGHPASTICLGDAWCAERLACATDDPQEARGCARRFAARGVDGLKLVYDGSRAGRLPQLRLEVMEAIVDEGHRLGLPVLAHTLRGIDAAEVALAGVDGIVHSPGLRTPDGRFVPALLNRFRVPVMATVRFSDAELFPPDEREAITRRLERRRVLRTYQDNGVDVLFGTDFQGVGMPAVPRPLMTSTFRVLKLTGFETPEIFQMLTGRATAHPMIPDDIGTIAVGKRADLLLIDGDPLEDINLVTEPLIVLKDGRIVVDRR